MVVWRPLLGGRAFAFAAPLGASGRLREEDAPRASRDLELHDRATAGEHAVREAAGWQAEHDQAELWRRRAPDARARAQLDAPLAVDARLAA